MNCYKITFVEATNYTKDTVCTHPKDKTNGDYLSVENASIFCAAESAEKACKKLEKFGRGINKCELIGLFYK